MNSSSIPEPPPSPLGNPPPPDPIPDHLDPKFLPNFANAVADGFGIPATTAFLLVLNVASAVLGASQTVFNPANGMRLPAGVNLLLAPPSDSFAAYGVEALLYPFTRNVRIRRESLRTKGLKALVLEHLHLVEELKSLNGYLESGPPRPVDAPAPWSKPKEDWIEATKPALLERIKAKQLRLREIEVECKPSLIVNGINRKDFAKIDIASFDGSIFKYSPDGYALRQLLRFRPAERLDVARLLSSAWSGRSFTCGVDLLVETSIANLWLTTRDELRRALSHPNLREEGFFDMFFVSSWDTGASDKATGLDESQQTTWSTLINTLWMQRLRTSLGEC